MSTLAADFQAFAADFMAAHFPKPTPKKALAQVREATLEDYRKALAEHDWFYDFSDDHGVWVRGQEQRNNLHRMAKRLDPDLVIWKQYERR